MKVGDKIRAVLEKYPEIKRNRAKLRAIYYTTRHLESGYIEWNTDHSNTDIKLTWYQQDGEGYKILPSTLHMKSLSEYNPPRTKKLEEGVKLLFKNGKFTLAPNQ